MSKPPVLLLLVCLLIGACSDRAAHDQAAITTDAKASSADKPNVILILADDLGWSDMGSYGGEISTPNLDSLAANGLRFTQFHNTAKCFPSRASLLTGQYAHTVGMGSTHRYPLVNDVTLADVMRKAGYRTLMVGKHHGVDNPYDLGFDHYWGLRSGATNYFNPGLQRPGEAKPAQKRSRPWCFDSKCLEPFTPDPDFYATDAFTDWSLELLKRYHDDAKPFFLYISYTAPHDPLHAFPEDIAKYRDKYRVGYDVIAEARYERLLESGLIDERFPRSDPIYRDWAAMSDEEREDQSLRMAVYAAMLDRLDQNIGRLIDYLKESGEFTNTLILFASDNGSSAEVVDIGEGQIGDVDRWSSLGPDWANVGNLPFRMFKNYSYQGGINTPFIVHWPQGLSAANRVSAFPGHFIDIMPTLLELTTTDYPDMVRDEPTLPVEGQSLLPLIANQSLAREKPLFWQWGQGRAVLEGHWKLVAWDGPETDSGGEFELYDMRSDKTETRNVAAGHPEVVARLSALYEQWYQRVSELGKKAEQADAASL